MMTDGRFFIADIQAKQHLWVGNAEKLSLAVPVSCVLLYAAKFTYWCESDNLCYLMANAGQI